MFPHSLTSILYSPCKRTRNLIIELLSTLNPKRVNQGYACVQFSNIFTLSSSQNVHKLTKLQTRLHAPRRNLGTLRHAKKHDNLRAAHTI